MATISDEIRVLSNRIDMDEDAYDELRELADRIDREMVELPRDRDGTPIHEGDKMYLDDGRMFVVAFIKFVDNDNPFFYLADVNRAGYLPSELTHTCPDSFESIASDIEAAVKWCDQNGDYGTGISSVRESTFQEWADRIRRASDERDKAGASRGARAQSRPRRAVRDMGHRERARHMRRILR